LPEVPFWFCVDCGDVWRVVIWSLDELFDMLPFVLPAAAAAPAKDKAASAIASLRSLI
jgi:hypothetical protein